MLFTESDSFHNLKNIVEFFPTLEVLIIFKSIPQEQKCQLIRKELVYMGNVFNIKDLRMTIWPLRSRIKAMQKIPLHKKVQECKGFCGIAYYLCIFCPNLQNL